MRSSDPHRINSPARTALSVLLLTVLLWQTLGGALPGALAQAETQKWSPPENISRSGAASQPRIFSGTGELTQVFWLDRFDGLVSSTSSGGDWSKPQRVPIPGAPDGMPQLVYDNSGWVHAFWQVADPASELSNSLYTSRMPLGSTSWSTPELLAEDALTYAIYAPADSGLSLAYVRRNHSDVAPAGVYTRWLASGDTGWGLSQNIFPTIYYRLLTPGSSNINIVDDGAGNQFVTWFDPLQNRTLIAQSNDRGSTWSQPANLNETLTDGIDGDSPVRLVALPGQVLSIRQSSGINSCILYQQKWQAMTLNPAISDSGGTTAATVTPSGWSAAEQIFPNLPACPVNDRFILDAGQGRIYWLWGEGSSSLSLSAWNEAAGQWSIPAALNIAFQDASTGDMVALTNLQATLAGDQIFVTGQSPSGEIYVTKSTQPGLDLIFAPASDWGETQKVNPAPAEGEGYRPVQEFSMAMDEQGKVHLVYSLRSNEAQGRISLGASLNYTFWDPSQTAPGEFTSHTIELFPGEANNILRQPNLYIDPANESIHLVWSGGEQGDILYSRAPLERADILSEWFPAQTLSGLLYNSWPQIGSDAAGNLYVISIIPINEERGVYLFTSEDRGQTWSAGQLIFDAATPGLQGLDHPTLLVTPDGALYVAWVETTPAGSNSAQRIFYLFSPDGGLTWNDPLVVAGPGNDWPRLAIADGSLHLLYAQTQPGQDDLYRRGSLWQRAISLEQLTTSGGDQASEGGWSPALRVPGWDAVSLPFGVATDGLPTEGRLHLAGITSMGLIQYSVWENENWTSPETVAPGYAAPAGGGLSGAARLLGDTLALSWLTFARPNNTDVYNDALNSGQETDLLFLTRRIDPVEIRVTPTAIPTQTATAPPQPTATEVLLTPTPDLNIIPNPSGSPQAPLIVGIMLPFIIVVAFFTWRILSRRRR